MSRHLLESRKVGPSVGLYLINCLCDIRATPIRYGTREGSSCFQDLFLINRQILKQGRMTRGMLVARPPSGCACALQILAQDTERINCVWDNFDVAYFMSIHVRIRRACQDAASAPVSPSRPCPARPLRVDTPTKIWFLQRSAGTVRSDCLCCRETNLSFREARIHTGKDGRVLTHSLLRTMNRIRLSEQRSKIRVKTRALIDSGEKLQPPVQGVFPDNQTFPDHARASHFVPMPRTHSTCCLS